MDEEQQRIGKKPIHCHSSIKPGLPQEPFELALSIGIPIEAGVDHDGNVLSRYKALFTQTPTFP
jgi:hypothetical protein